MWQWYAVLAALCAAATALFAKAGLRDLTPLSALTMRTTVVFLFVWILAFSRATAAPQTLFYTLTWFSGAMLVLSGVATGLSWLFGFMALADGDVAVVNAIDKSSLALTVIFGALIFGEPLTAKALLGCALILAGTFVLVF